ncbi:MAG TPA: hypothetical protein VHA82_12305 [Ramlibacter sp.]|uniref:hypothetical protein n=1 Tax=Ramlibacter sp. TaxID=1917967 RepID=UPI002C6C240A|nr:hypothetical protein [Ramlibacter sp.]HVZ44584.1 hypothetical protein [Ramlibacter sp.]
MTQPRLFAIVPGFGEPHTAHKEEILRGNLAVFGRSFAERLVRVCCYTPGYRLPGDLQPAVDAVYEPGIVGHFLLKHAHPEEIGKLGATHVAIVLDDVELLPGVDLGLMLKVMAGIGANIASPALPAEPPHFWKYMMREADRPPGAVVVSTCCELFCYLMTLEDYRRYFLGLDVTNPWCWGVDLTLHRVRGLKAAIFNDMVMRHWYRGAGENNGALAQEAAYYARRGLTKQELVGSQRLEMMQYKVMDGPGDNRP